jgi:hypothetical protein
MSANQARGLDRHSPDEKPEPSSTAFSGGEPAPVSPENAGAYCDRGEIT